MPVKLVFDSTARMSPTLCFSALLISFCVLRSLGAAVPVSTNTPQPEIKPPTTPREFFNAGTELLRQQKLKEAEAFLQTVLTAQNENLQPPALYNLGHVRFGQGIEELKKNKSAGQTTSRAHASSETADSAIKEAEEALASEDVKKMVEAYLQGRGARRGLKEATKLVKQAMDAYGDALSKWQRSSGDFKSAAELNPLDADARQNADSVDRSIAKLIDSMRKMQEMAAQLGKKKQELGEKMKGLKGKIPQDQMPPGAAGDDEEEEDQPNGTKPEDKEAPGKQGEQQQQLTLSPEQAAWLLEGFKLDSERRLPMDQKDTGDPRNKGKKPW